MSVEIKKVKKTKAERLEITYKKEDADNSSCEVTEKHASRVHVDFNKALDELRVHFGLLTGYIKASDVKQPKDYGKEIDSFHVSGFSIGGEDEDQGIVITGHRILPGSGKAIILNSPFTRFNEDPATRYKFMDELIKVLVDVKDETTKYMGGKFYTDVQGALPFDKTEEHQ